MPVIDVCPQEVMRRTQEEAHIKAAVLLAEAGARAHVLIASRALPSHGYPTATPGLPKFWTNRTKFYCFCDTSVSRRRRERRILLAGGGMRASCSHTLAAAPGLLVHMLFCHGVKT